MDADAQDHSMMSLALKEAERAYEEGEIPVGAVLTLGGEIIARGHNRSISLSDPTAHAEILALRMAGEREGNYRLPGATLYVTLEPCLMCAGAILQARLKRIVFGAFDPKGGAVVTLYRVLQDERLNHSVEITGGVQKERCGKILSRFFREKRVIATIDPGQDY
ncbi:MAG TPA: tRNA adenosine(34) deaminase TadA [Syntrophales bacterium]|jgi:tRNA(adenine34) deaminase|nr:tRNA adenosine(34) deaminase TadA [Syntrophales bacterium]HPX57249.1 tRNA adenosine(34) deaminase TadA [Syntrophales bacterium]HQA83604.1 tRNA adenosine(34) deaminase TadA [Syntrophales bacterium]